jgi:hypothetical protein
MNLPLGTTEAYSANLLVFPIGLRTHRTLTSHLPSKNHPVSPEPENHLQVEIRLGRFSHSLQTFDVTRDRLVRVEE